MSAQRPQKWLFPVGSGSDLHLAGSFTDPVSRCGFDPRGDGNGVFWAEMAPKPHVSAPRVCMVCLEWLAAHPQPAPSAWTPGPPTQEGHFWVRLPIHDPANPAVLRPDAVMCEVTRWDGRLRYDTPGDDCGIGPEQITHHIPLQKPEAP